MRNITEVIVHCSATRPGQKVDASVIRGWHMRDRGFADIGYHYVVGIDGTVERGRALEKMGAHCLGHNANSVGVCYIGGLDSAGKPADTRTAAQKDALVRLLRELKGRFPGATVHGHREFAAKACPCFDAQKEYCGL